MIVPGGGISLDGTRWVACRPNFLLAVEVLSCLFRRLVLEKLAAAHCAGELQFFGKHMALTQSKSLRGLFGTAAQQRLGRLCQASIRGTGGSPALSCALHPPRRHLQPPPDLGRRGKITSPSPAPSRTKANV